VVDGMKIPVPFNLNSLYAVFPPKFAGKLEDALIKKFGFGKKIPILKLKESTYDELKFLADYIYDNVFYGYTTKQWNLKPEELDNSVTARIPVFVSRDDRYFQDSYQGIPAQGYAEMFENMLNHPNINLQLETDFRKSEKDFEFDKLIYTGPIDEFFDDIHGKLPYRSLNFDFRTFDREFYQEVSQVNYPNNFDFTRITEFKHFNGEKNPKTTVAFEFPQNFVRGENDPYYPIPRKENEEIYKKYKNEADKLSGSVYFAGRLAEYRYYNMDQIVAAALNLFETKIAAGFKEKI
jgi:UDP-galactopyranose mutase